MNFIDKARQDASAWARSLTANIPFVVLDTETSGLGSGAEIVQLGILDFRGNVILDCLIKPRQPQKLLQVGSKGKSAFDIHGIHPDHLDCAPTWKDIHPALCAALDGRHLIIYNRGYDWPLIEHNCLAFDLRYPQPVYIECAMLQYAKWYGDWNDYHQSFSWKPLPPIPGNTAHAAIADCRATLALIKQMADTPIDGSNQGE